MYSCKDTTLTFTAQITNLPIYMKWAKFTRTNEQLRKDTNFLN